MKKTGLLALLGLGLTIGASSSKAQEITGFASEVHLQPNTWTYIKPAESVTAQVPSTRSLVDVAHTTGRSNLDEGSFVLDISDLDKNYFLPDDFSGLQVYPNPGRGEISAVVGEADDISCHVYDLLGRSLNDGNCQAPVDIRSAGVYIAKVVGDDDTQTEKFTVVDGANLNFVTRPSLGDVGGGQLVDIDSLDVEFGNASFRVPAQDSDLGALFDIPEGVEAFTDKDQVLDALYCISETGREVEKNVRPFSDYITLVDCEFPEGDQVQFEVRHSPFPRPFISAERMTHGSTANYADAALVIDTPERVQVGGSEFPRKSIGRLPIFFEDQDSEAVQSFIHEPKALERTLIASDDAFVGDRINLPTNYRVQGIQIDGNDILATTSLGDLVHVDLEEQKVYTLSIEDRPIVYPQFRLSNGRAAVKMFGGNLAYIDLDSDEITDRFEWSFPDMICPTDMDMEADMMFVGSSCGQDTYVMDLEQQVARKLLPTDAPYYPDAAVGDNLVAYLQGSQATRGFVQVTDLHGNLVTNLDDFEDFIGYDFDGRRLAVAGRASIDGRVEDFGVSIYDLPSGQRTYFPLERQVILDSFEGDNLAFWSYNDELGTHKKVFNTSGELVQTLSSYESDISDDFAADFGSEGGSSYIRLIPLE